MHFSIFHTVSKHSISWHRQYIFLGPKIWSSLPENFKNINSLQNFKILIKNWKPENCPCRLLKFYIKQSYFYKIRNSVLFPKIIFNNQIQYFSISGSLMRLNNTVIVVVLFGMHDLLLQKDSTS